MRVENPGDVRVTLTITMTVDQWEVVNGALTANLKANWNFDVGALRDAIGDASRKIRAIVTSDQLPGEER